MPSVYTCLICHVPLERLVQFLAAPQLNEVARNREETVAHEENKLKFAVSSRPCPSNFLTHVLIVASIMLPLTVPMGPNSSSRKTATRAKKAAMR